MNDMIFFQLKMSIENRQLSHKYDVSINQFIVYQGENVDAIECKTANEKK